MPVIQHNPPTVYPPYRCYSHANEIRGDSRLLIISGLNGYTEDGKSMPRAFEDQGELVWKHMGAILRSAGMDYANLVSVRTYLSKPDYDSANVRLRTKYLGTNRPALTVVVCQLLMPEWKIEVEAMAAV